MRKAVKKVLGQQKYDFFFDKFLEYFFTEKDAEFFASLGLNCIRYEFLYIRHRAICPIANVGQDSLQLSAL